MRFLIVDDSRAMRMIVKRQLRQLGFDEGDFVEAADGAEALAVLRAETVGVVLCDWNMPNMSGLELLQALRAEGVDIPFGFITSEATPDMRRLASDAGARFFVTKPFAPETLQAALAVV